MRVAGITQNISMRGVSFIAAAYIEIGAYIELDVYLQPPNDHRRGVKVHGDGTVLRVDSLGFVEKRIAAEVLFEREPEAAIMFDLSVV